MKEPEELIFDFFHNKQSVESEPFDVLVGIIRDRDAQWEARIDIINSSLKTAKEESKPTVRQQYAMAALTGMLAYKDRISNINRIALESFAIADAMIAQEAKE